MEVVRTQIGVITYLVPTGPLDDQQALDVLHETAEACLADRAFNLALDLTKVPLMSSNALESLLDIQDKFFRVGGSLKIVHSNSLLKEIFLVTGISDRIEIIEED